MEVEELIKNSLIELRKIVCENPKENDNETKEQDSRLIFPKYRTTEKKRISEEEARFLFVRELENQKKNHRYYYSIETPTKRPYKKFTTDNPEIEGERSRSGCIDVTLYEKEENGNFCRKHLIEFKFDNVGTCKKDFLKLLCDDNQCETNYYVNILENCDNYTINGEENGLKKKFEKSIQYIFEKSQNDDNYQICSNLNLRIFVFIRGNNDDERLKPYNFVEYGYEINSNNEVIIKEIKKEIIKQENQ